MAALRSGNLSRLERIADERYDSSSDYWKVYLNEDGTITKVDDGREDYYLQTKEGEFKIWDIKSRKDLRSKFEKQLEDNDFYGYEADKKRDLIYKGFDSYDYSDRQMTSQGYMQTVNADISIDDLSYVDKELYKRIGLYDILNSNDLFNGYKLNSKDFNSIASKLQYFDELGYYIDVSNIGEKLLKTYKGGLWLEPASRSIFAKEPSSVNKFNGASFLDIFTGAINEDLGYYSQIEGTQEINKPYYDNADRRSPELPKIVNDPEGNYYKSQMYQRNVQVGSYGTDKMRERYNFDSSIGSNVVSGFVSVKNYVIGATKSYTLGDYTLTSWNDQFRRGNDYFTIQAYCPMNDTFSKNSVYYSFRFVSPTNIKFNSIIKDAQKKTQGKNNEK